MYYKNRTLIFSPTDVTTFWESRFASWMDRCLLENPHSGYTPDGDDELKAVLQRKGFAHEANTIERFTSSALNVALVGTSPPEVARQETLAAMKDGADVIYQARLEWDVFGGFADFLVRRPGVSRLGDYRYEVWDSKLSGSLKPQYILQLCMYSEMLEGIQGIRPDFISVVLGNGDIKRLEIQKFYYYYQEVKDAFLDFHQQFDPAKVPDPEKYRSYGRWNDVAERILTERDSLSQVARIATTQIKNIQRMGIATMEQLATTNMAAVPKVRKEVFHRLKKQAQLQIASRGFARPLYEVIPPDSYSQSRGLWRLPPPSVHDIYFDMEGFPLIDSGLEYLWGASFLRNGKLEFKDFWAHNREEEKRAFEEFIDWVYELWRQDPTMHIYHYHSYETSAIKRLMGRFGSREDEVDDFLRAGVFVDLCRIVMEGLMIGEPRYSIKNVERLYRGRREGDVKDAGTSVAYYQMWLEERDGDDWTTSKILRGIRDYNRDDCDSTYELAEWLRKVQRDAGVVYAVPRGDDAAKRSDVIVERSALKEALSQAAATRPEGRLLSQLVDFHKRADKPKWWRYFNRLSQSAEELFDDLECLADLSRYGEPEVEGRTLLCSYRFSPDQDAKLRPGQECVAQHDPKLKFKIKSLDLKTGVAQLVCSKQVAPPEVMNLILYDNFGSYKLGEAVKAYCEEWLSDTSKQDAVTDLLRRSPPRVKGHRGGVLLSDGKTPFDIVRNLEGSLVFIQGPPGAGKTYTASHMMADLVAAGYRVGITSNSHKAINNLLEPTLTLMRQRNPLLHGVKVQSDGEDELFATDGLVHAASAGKLVVASDTGIIAGTAWAFVHPNLHGVLDYLFIDEAGQVAIANVVAMAKSTKNIVLMGDQMQLGQPIEGSHPGESGLSVLEYFLGKHATIPPELGIFLPQTFRLHPKICRFISEAVYDGRLRPAPGNEGQRLVVPSSANLVTVDSGLLYVPVVHAGNSQASEEEVVVIERLVAELTGRQFISKEGRTSSVTLEDILIMAPYNLQVQKISDALPGARVGTIDRFQGQEAPVVIVSMCASEAQSGRGISFLFDINRLNVALTRAKALAIVVGHPELGLGYARSEEEMQLLNFYCRLIRKADKSILP